MPEMKSALMEIDKLVRKTHVVTQKLGCVDPKD